MQNEEWQGTEAEARALLNYATRIATKAQDDYSGYVEVGKAHTLTKDIQIGEWVCELTSAWFRGDPAIWRLGRVVAIESGDLGPIYTLETLHGQRIEWTNALIVRVLNSVAYKS